MPCLLDNIRLPHDVVFENPLLKNAGKSEAEKNKSAHASRIKSKTLMVEYAQFRDQLRRKVGRHKKKLQIQNQKMVMGYRYSRRDFIDQECLLKYGLFINRQDPNIIIVSRDRIKKFEKMMEQGIVDRQYYHNRTRENLEKIRDMNRNDINHTELMSKQSSLRPRATLSSASTIALTVSTDPNSTGGRKNRIVPSSMYLGNMASNLENPNIRRKRGSKKTLQRRDSEKDSEKVVKPPKRHKRVKELINLEENSKTISYLGKSVPNSYYQFIRTITHQNEPHAFRDVLQKISFFLITYGDTVADENLVEKINVYYMEQLKLWYYFHRNQSVLPYSTYTDLLHIFNNIGRTFFQIRRGTVAREINEALINFNLPKRFKHAVQNEIDAYIEHNEILPSIGRPIDNGTKKIVPTNILRQIDHIFSLFPNLSYKSVYPYGFEQQSREVIGTMKDVGISDYQTIPTLMPIKKSKIDVLKIEHITTIIPKRESIFRNSLLPVRARYRQTASSRSLLTTQNLEPTTIYKKKYRKYPEISDFAIHIIKSHFGR
ncbi:hypothetical protein SNEBB_006064 [Seison nebaliae]|nr:hypothetical protein SNEBB_006064 [Seison nebaliae]